MLVCPSEQAQQGRHSAPGSRAANGCRGVDLRSVLSAHTKWIRAGLVDGAGAVDCTVGPLLLVKVSLSSVGSYQLAFQV
jgi:hypothetical protein